MSTRKAASTPKDGSTPETLTIPDPHKGFGKDYELLLALAQMAAMLNLYDQKTSEDAKAYLENSTPGAKKNKQENQCQGNAAALSAIGMVLVLLKPYLDQKDIQVGWNTVDEKYVILYKGKMLELKDIDE